MVDEGLVRPVMQHGLHGDFKTAAWAGDYDPLVCESPRGLLSYLRLTLFRIFNGYPELLWSKLIRCGARKSRLG